MNLIFEKISTISTNDIVDLFKEYYINLEDFVLDMTFDLAHDYLFLTVHFPIFFIIQSIWICLLVRQFNSKFNWWKSFLLSFTLSALGRILVAFITNRRPPLYENPFYLFFFFLIWFLINCFPFDLIFKIFNNFFIYFLLQLFNNLILIREISHGVDIGLRAFPQSLIGSSFIGLILSSTDIFIWLIFNKEIRQYSMKSLIKNLIFSFSYLFITQFPEYFDEYIDTTREGIKIYSLGIFILMNFIDILIFGLRNEKIIDFSLLTYLIKLFKYYGN